MEIKTHTEVEELAKCQRQEFSRLERLVGSEKAAQIEGIMLVQNLDALAPAFEAIPLPNIRIRAAACTERMMEVPSFKMGSRGNRQQCLVEVPAEVDAGRGTSSRRTMHRYFERQ